MSRLTYVRSGILLAVGLTFIGQGCSSSGAPGSGATSEPQPGQTDFTTSAPGATGGPKASGPGAATATLGGGASNTMAASPSAPGAPGGRIADVQEADIYKIDNNRLFYLNTYRGFLAYDITDAQHPKTLGRLGVYGTPIEMFVKDTTVYALLSDVLYLTQQSGQLVFQRRNVSQLVTIDVSDPANPVLLNATDIIGELREGVSRKIDDTIYVVSYEAQSYYWGWEAPGYVPPKEQAWVYSFNVADAKNPTLVQKLEIFEGGSVQFNDKGTSYERYFNGVTIAATSNALMVVENWSVSVWNDPAQGVVGRSSCGSYDSDELAIVSIIDVSDPTGVIRLHTKFQTSGWLSDQFKQTYVFDPTAKTGTYYGMFNRNVWSSDGCAGSFSTQNALESWDVTNGAAPARLDRLDFGGDQEQLAGSIFDTTRNVAYAVTSRQIDPLYALDITDRANLKILSSVGGLSGSMSVFRPLEGGTFLMGIGTDQSNTCAGFQGQQSNFESSGMAVSIIDVRDLTKIRLVQRACVSVQNANWVSSQITWNMDQAQKMIGMYEDATANVVTVPVSYYQQSSDKNDWWWRWQTAVGIMAWDLSVYDDTKPPEQQTVLKNYGTFIHPDGQVNRSILFSHGDTGAPADRMMINLSDTYMSIASLADLNAPALLANVEVAPYETAILRFGDYVVEEVQSQQWYGWAANDDLTSFRVKKAGGDVQDQDAVATFSLTHVASVFKHGDNQLVALRYIQPQPTKENTAYQPPTIVAQVYDLTDPTKPRLAGSATLPSDLSVYYGYWCGDWFWGAWGFYGSNNNVISTTSSLVFLGQVWSNDSQTTRLVSLDLTNADAPAVSSTVVATATNPDWWNTYGLVADPVDPRGFYLTYRQHVGDTKAGDLSLAVFKDYAQRWDLAGGTWTAGDAVNLPGQLANTYADANGTRMFLAQDYKWFWVVDDATMGTGHGDSSLRLSLLRAGTVSGRGVAELLDSKVFDGVYPSTMVLDSEHLMLVGHHDSGYGYFYPSGIGATSGGVAAPGMATAALSAPAPVADDSSDRLLVYDLSHGGFASLYDAPTGMYGSDLVGVHDGRLLVSLSGDGFLVVDVSDPGAPVGVRFVRTLGWANDVEFADGQVYVASGYFGVQHFDVGEKPVLLPTN